MYVRDCQTVVSLWVGGDRGGGRGGGGLVGLGFLSERCDGHAGWRVGVGVGGVVSLPSEFGGAVVPSGLFLLQDAVDNSGFSGVEPIGGLVGETGVDGNVCFVGEAAGVRDGEGEDLVSNGVGGEGALVYQRLAVQGGDDQTDHTSSSGSAAHRYSP